MGEVRRSDAMTVPARNRAALEDDWNGFAQFLADYDFDIHDHLDGRGDLDIVGYDGNDFGALEHEALRMLARHVDPDVRSWWVYVDDDGSTVAVRIFGGQAAECPHVEQPVNVDRGPLTPAQVQSAMWAAGDADPLDADTLVDLLASLMWGLKQWGLEDTTRRLRSL